MNAATTRVRAYHCPAVDLSAGRVVEVLEVMGADEEHAARALLALARERGFQAPQLGKTGRVVYPVSGGNLCWTLPKTTP